MTTQPRITSAGPVQRLIIPDQETMINLSKGWMLIQTKSRWWADVLIKNGFVEITNDDYNALSAINESASPK